MKHSLYHKGSVRLSGWIVYSWQLDLFQFWIFLKQRLGCGWCPLEVLVEECQGQGFADLQAAGWIGVAADADQLAQLGDSDEKTDVRKLHMVAAFNHKQVPGGL